MLLRSPNVVFLSFYFSFLLLSLFTFPSSPLKYSALIPPAAGLNYSPFVTGMSLLA